MKIYSQAPYYDDYDPSKGYTQILAVPGLPEQAREFTQVGTISRDFISRLGDSLYRDGTIIDGCTLVIRDQKAIISSGRIYLDGLVRLVDGVTLELECTGSEVIGAKVITSIVTELEDESLRDPAQEYEGFGEAGAHRIKETVVFTVNDDVSASIYRIEDGELVTSDAGLETSTLTETLARRTYDESGNYKVDGLNLRDRSEERDGQILLTITEGKAYIKGYEVSKNSASTFSVKYSQTTRLVSNEPKTYRTGTDVYTLTNQPVKSISSVAAKVNQTDSITRGNIRGGIDYLTKTPVLQVKSVKQGGTTYKQGTDYQLTNDGIDWSLSGDEPSIGTSYTVEYEYNKTYVPGAEISLYLDPDTKDYQLKFTGDSTRPVDSSQMNITYEFYLARKDLVCLTKLGEVNVLEGKPDILRLVESPINQNDNQIEVGTVTVYPNSSEVAVVNFTTSRLTQSELYNMLRRINDLEYNQAISDLDTEAIDGESATELKGVFTDGFIGLTKSDISHPEYDCTIDLDNSELSLPTISNIVQVKPDMDNAGTTGSQIGTVITAPYNEVLALSQRNATTTMLVNPYAVYDPMSLIKLTPAVDNWIDTEKIAVADSVTKTTSLRRWWYHQGEAWAESERAKWQALGFADGGQSLKWDKGSVDSTTVTTQVLEEAIMYMRQIPVEVSASNFTALVDNIKCYFNDTLVPLTPTGSTQSGTESGTVRADSKGKFTAKFTVPPNVPCGSVSVVLKSGNSQGSATYSAKGRKQIIKDTVLVTTTVVEPYDPLAQSFMFDADTIITKLGLYFANKGADKTVVVQIRNMINGYPGTTCYATTQVDSDDIKTSSDGSAETIVRFDQPVYCTANEQYCVCILSDSNEYSMYVAELGAKDITTGIYVTSQPYSAGVLFSSSNALTWTAHQSMDLKFNIYKAEYTGEGQILFQEVTSSVMNRLVLAAQVVDYQNVGITWYYRVSADSSWLPLNTYVDRDLSAQTTKVQLKSVLSNNRTTSPIIAGDCVNLITFIEKTTGAYVSRMVSMSNKFTKITVSMNINKPSGTEVKAYYKTELADEWVELTSPKVVAVDDEFSQYTYSATLSGGGAKTYRVKITMETSNPLIRPRVKKLMNILKY